MRDERSGNSVWSGATCGRPRGECDGHPAATDPGLTDITQHSAEPWSSNNVHGEWGHERTRSSTEASFDFVGPRDQSPYWFPQYGVTLEKREADRRAP
jgi:hypothetical protein